VGEQSTDGQPLGDANWWTRFWHLPVRGECLAGVRIAVALVLLMDQLVQYLPALGYLYGPEGVAPAGINDGYAARTWRWTILLFHTDDMTVVRTVFFVWMAATVGLLVGWRSQAMAMIAWLILMMMIARNPNHKNGGDDVAMVSLFLLMISPCGAALSLDRLRRLRKWRRMRDARAQQPPLIPPWAVRLFQIQLCVIYASTGVAKLRGEMWWELTAVHYVMNDITMTRWPFARLPLPIWITAPLSLGTLVFELGFTPLALWRRTRKWVLWAGVLFHLGIFAAIEVGWFSFYTMAMYAAWIPSQWWARRFDGPQPNAG